jgi:RNA polymerase sigma-70 factor (ECF subfamily)
MIGAGKLLPFRRTSVPAAEMSDRALVAACAVGDPAALGALFDQHGDSVHRFLSRLTGASPSDLDDLVHTTFLEVFRSARRFRAKAAVLTWIFGIAVNVSRHHARGESRRRAALVSLSHGLRAHGQRPDDAAEQRQLLARVAAALDALPHDLRAVFVLCEMEDLSGREAAAALGVRPGTVGRRLYEARQQLRAAGERGDR